MTAADLRTQAAAILGGTPSAQQVYTVCAAVLKARGLPALEAEAALILAFPPPPPPDNDATYVWHPRFAGLPPHERVPFFMYARAWAYAQPQPAGFNLHLLRTQGNGWHALTPPQQGRAKGLLPPLPTVRDLIPPRWADHWRVMTPAERQLYLRPALARRPGPPGATVRPLPVGARVRFAATAAAGYTTRPTGSVLSHTVDTTPGGGDSITYCVHLHTRGRRPLLFVREDDILEVLSDDR